MKWAEVKAWLEENKGEAEVSEFLKALSPVSMDNVKDFLENTEEGKTYLQREKDKHFTKSLETWKANNLTALVDAKVKELYPDETEESKRIRALEQKLAEKEEAEKRQMLLNKALTVATEKKLPTQLVEFLLGEDEEKTLANIAKLEEVFEPHIAARVDERFKENGYQPGQGAGAKGVAAASIEDIVRETQIRQD